MPTAAPIPPMPADVFGELGQFFVEQHTESMQLGIATLRIQTSGNQTDDRTRGTWHVALTIGRDNVFAQTQIAWCTPTEARSRALAWARDSLRGVAEAAATTDTVLEPELVEPDETVREDIAALPSG